MLRANGFVHHQYSDHCKDNVMAITAFLTMIQLVTIPPLDKLPTTIKGKEFSFILTMFYPLIERLIS